MDQVSLPAHTAPRPTGRVALVMLAGAALGVIGGAAVGWIEWATRLFSGFSLALLLLVGAALGYGLWRRVKTPWRGLWLLFGALLGISLTLGYQAAGYQAFRTQLTGQINDQLRSQNVVPVPAAVSLQIDAILEQTGGSPGFIGYEFTRLTENGLYGLVLFVARILIVAAAAAITAREAERPR